MTDEARKIRLKYILLQKQAKDRGLEDWESWPKMCDGPGCTVWIGCCSDWWEVKNYHDLRMGGGPWKFHSIKCLIGAISK